MVKIINLQPEEEITSVVERLWETGEEEIFLVAPRESALLKNIIGLKLLKREAERLGKEIILITKDEVGREMAKRVGLSSRVSLPKQKEIKEEEDVLKEVPSQDFESLLEKELKAKRKDVARGLPISEIRPKGRLTAEEKKFFPKEKELPEEIGLPPAPEELIYKKKKDDYLPDSFSFAKLKEELKDESISFGGEELAEKEDIESEPEAEEEELTFPVRMMTKEEKPEKKEKGKIFWFKHFLPKPKEISQHLKPSHLKKHFTFPIFSTKFLFIFTGAVLLIAASVLFFILPKAEIEIKPKGQAINQDLVMVADKGISKPDFSQNRIPAQLIKLDKRESKEILCSGERQVNEKAKGIITVYNEYSSSPQTLVEKTRFVSEGGKIFRTTKTVNVPGAKIQEGKIVASSLDVDVEADQPGSEFNIAPSRFTIPGFTGTPKFNAFYGRSKSAMSGGASGLVKVVSQEDYDKAKNEIWESLQPSLDKEFKRQIPIELKMLDSALKEEISGIETSAAIGEIADKFTMTLKGTATVLLFDEKDVLATIQKKIATNLNESNELVVGQDQISYQEAIPDFSRGQLSFRAKVSGKIVWKINIEQLRKNIAGRSENEVRQIFNQHSEIDEARVLFWPFWVNSVPNNLDKIKIQVRG
jgi:hypothetical protein